VMVSTIYLAVALRSIHGIPFGKQARPRQTQGGEMMARMLLFMLVSVISVGIQYLLYRSIIAVWAGTAVIALAAVFLTLKSLHAFHVTMIYHLSVTSGTATMIYKEVGEEEGEINFGG